MKTAPPTGTVEPRVPQTAPPPAVAARPEPVTSQPATARPVEKKPIYRKPWFWAAVGGSAVVVAAVVIAVVLTVPSGTWQNQPPFGPGASTSALVVRW